MLILGCAERGFSNGGGRREWLEIPQRRLRLLLGGTLHTFIVGENSIGSPAADTGGEMQGLGHAEVIVMSALWILRFGWSTG